jgi:hypothetical protein
MIPIRKVKLHILMGYLQRREKVEVPRVFLLTSKEERLTIILTKMKSAKWVEI